MEKLIEIMSGIASQLSDQYLSFEEVGSIILSDEEEKQYGYRYIDGIQLTEDNTAIVFWVSTYNSNKIFAVKEDKFPSKHYTQLINKVVNALGEKL